MGEDGDLITFIIDDLAGFKDKRAFEDIKKAFESGLARGFIINWEYVKFVYYDQ